MTRAQVDIALDLIAAVPGYQDAAKHLRRARIVLSRTLPDRAQTSLRGHITLGLEPFAGEGEAARVSLAGTLIHEHHHLRQRSLEKTASFWLGVVTRRPLMRRYEAPAYAAQQEFLRALARHVPTLQATADAELAQVQAAFVFHYGPDA